MVEMKVNVAGMRPEEYADEKVLQFATYDNTDDCVTVSEKEMKNGKGKLTQYAIRLNSPDGDELQMQYLLEKDLRHVVRMYGSDSKQWIGKNIAVSAFKVGQYWRWKIKPQA
jgi:hypothetical protein